MKFSAIMPRRGNIFYTLMEITLKSEAKSTCFPSREGMAAMQPGCVDPCNHAFMLARLFLALLLSATFIWPQPGVNILIKTNTPGAVVLFDDNFLGVTGLDGNKIIRQVPPGKHEIRIFKNGYAEKRQTVTAAENFNRFIFTLEKLPGIQPDLQENPKGTTGVEVSQTTGNDSSLNLVILLIIMVIIVLVLVLSMMAWILRNSRRRGVIGKFELLRTIGKGGIATTYKAKDLEKKKIIALKVLNPTFITDKDLVYKFFCEGEVIDRINREFPDAPVVKVFEFGRDREKFLGIPYIAMELVKGVNLLKMIDQDSIGPVSRKLHIAREVSRALVAAHRLGIVHGDITPDNIIVKGKKVTLIDFGVALQHHDNYKNMDGTVMGKPMYMSPEQCEGQPIDARSDVYSLGVILFFMFYGRPPFTAANPLEIMNMHKQSPLPELDTPVPGAIKELIYRMLDKDPGKRPGTPEVEETLAKFIHEYELK